MAEYAEDLSELGNESDDFDDFDESESSITGSRRRNPAHGIGANAELRERRRELHTLAEKKRRDAIKLGYEALQTLLPGAAAAAASASAAGEESSDSGGASKISKAAILQKSIDYIQYLEKKKLEEQKDLDKLQKEVEGLRIMKATLDNISRNGTSSGSSVQIPDDLKMALFERMMCCELFGSFNERVEAADFAQLSQTIFSWLETCATPEHLSVLCERAIEQLPADASAATLYEYRQPASASGSTSASAASLVVPAERTRVGPVGAGAVGVVRREQLLQQQQQLQQLQQQQQLQPQLSAVRSLLSPRVSLT